MVGLQDLGLFLSDSYARTRLRAVGLVRAHCQGCCGMWTFSCCHSQVSVPTEQVGTGMARVVHCEGRVRKPGQRPASGLSLQFLGRGEGHVEERPVFLGPAPLLGLGLGLGRGCSLEP